MRLDCGTQKKLRLMENAKEWEDENRELKTQVGGQRSELDATIAFLRRQEGSERRACDEDVAARDGEIGEAEAQLRAEQRRHERAEFELSEEASPYHRTSALTFPSELSEELREVMMEATDKQEQVDFWKNYPFNQNLEKREKIKCLKLGIQQIDQLHDAFETQLDGNFRYMQNYLVSGHVRRLERAKRSAAARALRHVSLSDHSDLVAQAALCLQSVINHQHGDTLRDHMDWIGERRQDWISEISGLDREHGGSDDSLSRSGSESDVSRLSDDQLLPFESPIQVPASVRRQALRPFEEWSRQRHWWRVQAPRPRTRRWPVTGPHLALYADQPPVFDLSGPKVINESPSVSSAHISDDWELGKVGWQEHLRRRSVISAGSAGPGLDAPPAAGRAHSGALDTRAGSSRAATGRAGGTAPPAARTGRSATGRPSGSSLAKSSSRSEVKTNASKQSITSAGSSKSVTTKASSKATLKTV
ncbi:hypothetical protein FJT64_005829 [Amphibalanus amphitrite]|uniref:Uncharacterized protein n=1 Tax=Amphibalanus amphitrite TaxID=1232801 RepID=A0A6A4VUY2_AMPAM|nr:hypothetical protein FJT64_005829 [Amphibalanus amphitrite]